MTPNEALLLRIQVLEGHARMHNEMLGAIPDDSSEVSEYELSMLADGELYTWRDDFIQAAIAAAQSLPSPVTFGPQLMPSPAGLYLFDAGVRLDGFEYPLRGIGWAPMGETITALFPYADPTITKPVIGPLRTAANFIVKNGCDVDLTSEQTVTDFRVIQTNAEVDALAGNKSVARFLIASWLWLKQRVMVPTEAPVSSKVQKQADRAKVRRAVNIIVLRRAEPRQSGADAAEAQQSDAATVAWSCQWLVRGHWRQQFYPSTKEHRPIWIEAHVKGPETQPLKAPSTTVFTVQR